MRRQEALERASFHRKASGFWNRSVLLHLPSKHDGVLCKESVLEHGASHLPHRDLKEGN